MNKIIIIIFMILLCGCTIKQIKVYKENLRPAECREFKIKEIDKALKQKYWSLKEMNDCETKYYEKEAIKRGHTPDVKIYYESSPIADGVMGLW